AVSRNGAAASRTCRRVCACATTTATTTGRLRATAPPADPGGSTAAAAAGGRSCDDVVLSGVSHGQSAVGGLLRRLRAVFLGRRSRCRNRGGRRCRRTTARAFGRRLAHPTARALRVARADQRPRRRAALSRAGSREIATRRGDGHSRVVAALG